MKRSLILSLMLSIFSFIVVPAFAGTIYQNFETDNGLPVNIWPVGNASVSVVGRNDAVHDGSGAVRSVSMSNWTGVGVQARTSGFLNIKQDNNDRLTFWVYARPARLCYIYGCTAGTNNNVGVRFYDNDKYAASGFEVWTTQTATYSTWSKLKVLYSQLPPDFDLTHVTKIEFKHYNPGNYYIDDIQVQREDRVYQSFEKQERSGSTDNEYGWKWNDADTAATTVSGEPVFEGSYAWKLVSVGKWSGTGIQSGDKRYVDNAGNIGQDFWHVDLAPGINDRLTFWVYALPTNGMDNNISIQVYDNGNHNTDDKKVVFWPKTMVVNGAWTRVEVPFAELLKSAPDLNLKDINKIQFQNYWPGTFYIDDIRATGPIPVLKQLPSKGLLQWNAISPTVIYRLQESATGVEGTWKTIYVGNSTQFYLDHIGKNFLRVRWEEPAADKNSVVYASPWSNVVEFMTPSVVFNFNTMQSGILTWSALPQAVLYEIQWATSKSGPWTLIYRGSRATLNANIGKWYRVRAVQEINKVVVGLTPWSRPQTNNHGKGFVKAVGTVIKDGDGLGDTLVLNGVNLGSLFVIEPWMTGLGFGDTPALNDDWTIRNVLTSRFGNAMTQSLLKTYQYNYISEFDFDYLVKSGITVVRLPFYYRNLQDDNGNWIRDVRGQIDFSAMDRIVNALSDRGIYTVLDLHGAPGLQSADANTGRKDFNKLFAADGAIYQSRTIGLWQQVAFHYKNNPWVLGYDLLNEPVGVVPDYLKLANFYNTLYKSIRTVDPKHMIIMEGVWYTDPKTQRETVDWGTLPFPQVRNWTNIMYQFHFYHWDYKDANGNVQKADEDLESHKVFIEQKMAVAQMYQANYNVPVMIGEFYGFGLKAVWDYYISHFNARKWSWTSWSYKYHDSPSNWGMLNHVNYDDNLPSFRTDSAAVLNLKLSKYMSANYHAPNVTLQHLMEASAASVKVLPANIPYIEGISKLYVEPSQELTITGKHFGDIQNNGTVLYKGAVLPVISWSNTSIRVYVKYNQVTGSGPVTVKTTKGLSNGVDIIVVAHDPSMDPAQPSSTQSSLPETLITNFQRCDGTPLGTHGCV